jgi:[acyl-carrier-protein] S-malonyltransferase
MDVILLFPGQGSQKPGMGKELAASSPAARAVFESVDAALGTPLSRLCFDGPADELTQTQNAQPALLAHGIAAWESVRDDIEPRVRAAAGHSLGELTAYCATGAIDLHSAARLVRKRGEVMHQAGQERPGTMAAILGDTSIPLEDICAQASSSPDGGLVVPANYNSPGQTVISGEVAGVEKAMEMARDAGAKRAVRLPVSGAFHSPLMMPAREGLRIALSAVEFDEPRVPVYANVNAEPVGDATTAVKLLIEQLTSPVLWLQTVERLAARYPGALFLELGPGSVLATLVRKTVPGVTALSCGSPAEVDALLSRVAA